MKAWILDDEPLALESMERMLRKYDVEVIGTFLDPITALAACDDQLPDGLDVAFVDIEMPGMSGLAAAERLTERLPELHVVFVTAYDQYAVEAFELNATDYLVKPLQTKRLEKTLERLAARGKGRPAEATPGRSPMVCCFRRLSVMDAKGRHLELSWRTAKAKEVFAYLLHMRNEGVSKDALIDRMWPELDMAKAQTHLHTTIYQIRQTLKATELTLKLTFADGVYRLDCAGAMIDVEAWETVLERMEIGETPPRELLQLWTSLYRGDYFELDGYLWAEQERERLRLRWLEKALRLAASLSERTWSSDAYALLTDAMNRFPLAQESYFLLMRMYHAQGQTAEAKRTYEQLCEVLREEADTRPDAEIEDWVQPLYGKA
ncbi:response regulator [Paenibacillus sp. TRM 82003]|nr:response regulator [Paenibacillus sp. TRM 82003]